MKSSFFKKVNKYIKSVLIISVMCLATTNSIAQWSTNPAVNNAICTSSGHQHYPTIVDNDSGGAIITWYDHRSGNTDIYAQSINASGGVQWTKDGKAICTASNSQEDPTIIGDGSGGAIITWWDSRSGNLDIYAQRINASGVVQWTKDGVAICNASSNQSNPTIVDDGFGGAIITWRDYRSGNYDIYAQRINASGVVQWTKDGVGICTASANQNYPTIVSDGTEGAVITWQDFRSGNNYDIYAQRINDSGIVQWTANGIAICTASYDQNNPTIVSDSSGGAIITWYDYRSGNNYDIYAQRINDSGFLQWTKDGVGICTASYDQNNPTIVSDSSGGAIITWYDIRTGGTTDIFAQRINDSGDVQWTSNGVAICTAWHYQYDPIITTDGSGGAIIVWRDFRSGNYDIYAQCINDSGIVKWTSNGVAIHTTSATQYNPTVVSDGSSGAIITWNDSRSGNFDIYAQNVKANGKLGTVIKEINLKGNSILIADGDVTPSPSDHTDFETQAVCSGTIVRTFTIENTGTSDLTISSVNITGAGADDYSVTSLPLSPVAASASTTFQVTFDPSANGARNATITVNNDDTDEAAYDFAINGTGTSVASTVASQTNVTFSGGNNGAATVTVTGGIKPYTYLWAPYGGTAATALGLAVGTYVCTVTDANSCKAADTATIILEASGSQSNVSNDLKFTCSPNPFHKLFKLKFESIYEKDASISVYGMTGNLLENVNLNGFTNEIELGANLPNGIYNVSFILGAKTRVLRMIKVE